MSQLKIRVLGGFEAVDKTGRQIRFQTRKAAALLIYLAMSPGKEFSREHLMNLLWSDRAEAQASNSLRQALSHLRKTLSNLEAKPLIVSSEGARIDPHEVSVDAVEFMTVAAGNALHGKKVIELFGGAFLADFVVRDNAFEEWRRQTAMRIDALAVDTFESLLKLAIAEQDHEGARRVADVLLNVDPAHEGGHRAVMWVHSEKGRRGAALQQYEVCQQFLRRELGVEPEAETEELRRKILAGNLNPTPRPNDERTNTVGVLPFKTIEDDIEAQRFASGLAASIAMDLGRFKSISVVSAFSSLSFRDCRLDLGEIADILDVRYLVEGSVDRSAEGLQGFVRLLEPTSGRQVWGDRFDANAENVLIVIDELVQSIVAPLAVKVESEEIAAVRKKPSTNLDAYDHWLRGLSHLRVISEEDEKAAKEHFQAAINIDPSFARAHAGLALAYFNTWSCGAWGAWYDDMKRCFEAASTAIALDPSDHWPHMVLSEAYLFQREFEKAKAHYDRAIKLNPNDADLLAQGSIILTYLGEHEAGVEAGLLAMRLNPFYTDLYPYLISSSFQMAGRFEECLELGAQCPDAPVGDLSWRIALFVDMGDLKTARELASEFHRHFEGLYPGVSSTNDLREVLEAINPWKRQEDYDRFFGALEKAGVFDERRSAEDVPYLAVMR